MYIRTKKVGGASYVQLVESARTKQGPRAKVIASLGRADALQTSGNLSRLAAGFAKLAGIEISSDALSDVTVRAVSSRKLQHQLYARVARELRFSDACAGLAGTNLSSAELGDMLGQSFFAGGVEPHQLSALGSVEGLHTKVASAVSAEEDDDRLVVHISKSGPPIGPPSLLSGFISATAVNGTGQVLMTAHWLDSLPMQDMVAMHIERILRVLPGRRLTIVVDRTAMSKRLIAELAASDTRFVAPVREPGQLLDQMPDDIHERRLEDAPFGEIGSFRYVSGSDRDIAYKERQVRAFHLSQIEAYSPDDLRFSRISARLSEKVQRMERWDGATLLASNMEGEARSVMAAYMGGLEARAFVSDLFNACSGIIGDPDLPRDLSTLIDGIASVNILNRELARRLVEKVLQVSGRRMSFAAIRNVICDNPPLILSDGRSELVALPEDAEIWSDLLESLRIDPAELASMDLIDETSMPRLNQCSSKPVQGTNTDSEAAVSDNRGQTGSNRRQVLQGASL